MAANNFDTRKPTVIIYEGLDGAEDAIEAELIDGKYVVTVFKNLSKARKFAANKIDPKEHRRLQFANYDPVLGAGDREETNDRKCLKCGGFLRIDPKVGQTRSHLPGGDIIAIDTFACPKCDLGEQ